MTVTGDISLISRIPLIHGHAIHPRDANRQISHIQTYELIVTNSCQSGVLVSSLSREERRSFTFTNEETMNVERRKC